MFNIKSKFQIKIILDIIILKRKKHLNKYLKHILILTINIKVKVIMKY